MSQWTRAQHDAIHTTGSSILVSAAAGSGKTSVLAERCSFLVVDAKPRCSVDQLLVVTFAEEAAAEMKSRIEKTLTSRYLQALEEKSPDTDYLKWQAMLAPTAHISTLHAFCARLIRQNFHLAVLDPAFRVLDGAEAALMREELAEQLFEDALDGPHAEAVRTLIDLYGDGADEFLRERVIQTYETLRGLRDPAAWRRETVAKLEETAHAKALADCQIGRDYLKHVAQELRGCLAEAQLLLKEVRAYSSPGPYEKQAQEIITQVDGAIAQLDRGAFDAAGGILCNAKPSALRGKHDIPPEEAETFKKRFAALRKAAFGEDGAVRSLLALPETRLLADMANTVPHAKMFLELVREFEQRYHREKHQANALDFSDLEHVTLSLLGREEDGQLIPSALALRLHQRYEHVLVDEYQDINPVQERILQLVSRECLAGVDGKGGNLFCVGDVKQSIYRFRLAAPDIFLQRRESYLGKNGGIAIDLRENFRSRGVLLEAVNAVFVRLMTSGSAEIDYQQGHAFVPGLQYADVPGGFVGIPIELHVLEKDTIRNAGSDESDSSSTDDLEAAEMEARHVAGLVRSLLYPADGNPHQVWDKAAKAFRPMTPSDIVILLRSIRQRTREYAKAFSDAGIPLRSESRSGFFKAVEVQDVLAILRVLDNQQQDIPLAAVIRSPMAQVDQPEDALAAIACAYEDIPFHQAVTKYAAEQDDALAKQLKALLSKLATWRLLSLQRSTEELISTIYRETHIQAWYAALPNGEQRLANLQYLHECASKFATFSRQGLYRFLNYLEDLEERDSLAQPPAALDGHAVRLMTVHASKGLEYPVVIVAGLGNQLNLADSRESLLVHRDKGIALRVPDIPSNTRYPSIASHVIAGEITRASLAEELRVLYVAMTRAREQLILVGSAQARSLDRWEHAAPAPGTIPDEHSFLSCRCFLDWLVPLFAASNVNQLKLERVGTLPTLPARGPVARQDDLSAILPHGISEPYSPVPTQAIARLNYEYPYPIPTREPAAISVTTLAKGKGQGDAPALIDPDGEEISPDLTHAFEPPAFATVQNLVTTGEEAAERGTVTHLVMQHLDLNLPPEKLEEQIQRMVARKLITEEQAKLVDTAGIQWFLQTDTGELLREKANAILREVPFLDAIDPKDCPNCRGYDRVMLRGRIDALLPIEGGWFVLDYKTDGRVPQPGSEREQSYRRQVSTYRQAIERSGHGKVMRAELIFIRARRIVSVSVG